MIWLAANVSAQDLDFQKQVDSALHRHIDTLQAANPGKRLEASWQPLDPRLTLPVCTGTVDVTPLSDRNTGRTTAKVSCAGAGWQILVPILIRTFQTVAVATAPIARNERIGTHSVRLDEREIKSTSNGFFTDTAPLEGRLAKRSIAADQIITASMIKNPDIIAKGQNVIIEAASASFAVRSAGTALTNGGLGDTIKVKNGQSGRMVEGVVVSEGKVRVPL